MRLTGTGGEAGNTEHNATVLRIPEQTRGCAVSELQVDKEKGGEKVPEKGKLAWLGRETLGWELANRSA